MFKTIRQWFGCDDCEDIKQKYYEMYQLAHFDNLTGLSNRMMFTNETSTIFERCVDEAEPLTIFLIDLDNFKLINDTHGHHSGNSVLQTVANRLTKVAKLHTEASTIVSRLGGDEFVILFEGMDKHEAELAAIELNTELKKSFFVDQMPISVSASIGGSIYPWHGGTMSSLMRAADVAMYAAKENGKDQYKLYDPSMNTTIEKRVEAEHMIRDIIHTGNVNLYFQPIIELETNKVIGMEALLRNSIDAKRLFSPAELIEVAEETNLIVPLGTIILRTACVFARSCINAGADLILSVNVSAPQLTDINFPDIVADALHKAKLPAKNLILEITETMLMSNFEQSTKMLEQLRELGVVISIDDFGKGYSSLNYLQKLPIGKLKIDMSFVQSLGKNKKTDEIVKGIILMAEALQMLTCAEGVETQLQNDLLKEFGCTHVQGYFRYKALDPKEFIEMLKTENVARV